MPGARVELRFNDDPSPAAFGWAPSSIDGVDVEALATAAERHTLSQRSPTTAPLAPGARVPFVIIAPAPAQGTRARVLVQPRMDP